WRLYRIPSFIWITGRCPKKPHAIPTASQRNSKLPYSSSPTSPIASLKISGSTTSAPPLNHQSPSSRPPILSTASGSGLTTQTLAPLLLASLTIAAAGCTVALVPTTSIRSTLPFPSPSPGPSHSRICSIVSGGTDSPNQVT